MGADDFILMPVSADELSARLRQLHARDKRPGSPLQVRYGEIVLDCEMRQAYLSGQALGLTPYEFQLLRFLADRVGRVFTRQELLSRVWGYRHVGRVRTVDTHVLNLRAKLGTRRSAAVGARHGLQAAARRRAGRNRAAAARLRRPHRRLERGES